MQDLSYFCRKIREGDIQHVESGGLINFFINMGVHFYDAIIFFPFLSFAILWFIIYFILRNKKTATRISIDVTALLLLGAIARQMNHLFGSMLGFWLLILAILLAIGLIGRKQNELRGYIDFTKIARIMLRFGFIVLSCLYIVLLVLNKIF